jgi:D-alanyl-lipoteichoic acid acyltransferase DltB (MBOAT superfamily)
MLFSSFGYLLAFLPIVAAVNLALRRTFGPRAAQVWLLAASLFFYGWARPSHLPLLLGSIVFNWAVARMMAAQPEATRKRWLVIGLVCNVALLCSFKYIAFVFGRFFPVPNWDFPLGISFFTLTQIMYLVDVYQGLNGPIGLFDHATVVSFFPYVSSGPIVRAKEIGDQLPQPDVAASIC